MEINIDTELQTLQVALQRLKSQFEEVNRQRQALVEAILRTKGAIQFAQRLNQHKS